MGKNICKLSNWQGINLQNIQITPAAQYKKKKKKHKQPNQKTGRRPKETFLQRSHTDGQETHEMLLNITNYERNANQNYNEVSPHTSQNAHHHKFYKQ